MLPQINHEEYKLLLDIMMETRQPLLVVGKPGVGKTFTPRKYCEEHGIDLIVSHPAVDQPQDYKGLGAKVKATVPMAEKEGDELDALLSDGPVFEMQDINVAEHLPYAQMLKALQSTKPTIWFFDDLGQATPNTQSALMQLIGDRHLCGKKLPDCVRILAATNGKEHRANVKGLLEPIKSRFGMIVELIEDLVGWRKNFAVEEGIYQMISLFLEFKPEAFCQFPKEASMENGPNPRLWEKLSDALYAADKFKLPQPLRRKVPSATIGEAYGSQYAAFEELHKRIPTFDEVIEEPETFPIDQPLDIRFAMLGMLANKVTKATAESVFKYTNKMAKEYQIVFFRLLKRNKNDAINSDAAQRWWALNLDVYTD